MFELVADPVDALVERRAAEAIAALRQDCERAREEVSRRFAFINRSRAQKRRYERSRHGLAAMVR